METAYVLYFTVLYCCLWFFFICLRYLRLLVFTHVFFLICLNNGGWKRSFHTYNVYVEINWPRNKWCFFLHFYEIRLNIIVCILYPGTSNIGVCNFLALRCILGIAGYAEPKFETPRSTSCSIVRDDCGFASRSPKWEPNLQLLRLQWLYLVTSRQPNVDIYSY